METLRPTRPHLPAPPPSWLRQARDGVAAAYTPPVEHRSRAPRYHVGWLFDAGVVSGTILFGVLWLSA